MAIMICYSFILVAIFMGFTFTLAQILKDNSIVDIAWGLGFVLVAWFSFLFFSEIYRRKIIMVILISLWGFRLMGYIFIRKRGKGEDFRYQEFRKKWTAHFYLKSFFYIFLFQGVLLAVVSLPIIIVNRSDYTPTGIFDLLGIGIFFLGFAFETIADYQIYAFKKKAENRGKLMTRGLWKFSRHPNYFGEVTLWWGIYIFSLSVKNGWWGILSPVLISLIIIFFSGIPLLEKKYSTREDFQKYKSRTSVFIPWFPRK